VSFTPLTPEQLKARLNAAPGTWITLPNDFPDKMRAIRGTSGTDSWLVVEHDGFDGQVKEVGYDGTFTAPPGHMYRLPPDLAKEAYLIGKAYLDAQAKPK